MLAVLSEIDCLKTLQGKGVHPNEFYTNLEEFKNRVVFMKDATVLVIFAGNCRFNKKHTLEFVKSLMRRADTEKDSGIQHVYIISDMTLAGIRSYYKYSGNLDVVDIMHGWKSVKENVNIWPKLQTPECETVCHYSMYDSGEVGTLVEMCKTEASHPDPYQKLVQVPNMRKLLEDRDKAIAERAARKAELEASEATA